MAFEIEYLEDREALSKLGVDDYKSNIVDRVYGRGGDLWDEYGEGNKLLYIDKERDLWLFFLGHALSKDADRIDRSDGNPTEDIFLFNYKGNIVEILLRVSDESDEKMTNLFVRPFNTIYEFVEMNPSSSDDIDEMGLKKLICEALAMPNKENMKEYFFATYLNADNIIPAGCKIGEVE